MSVYQALAVMAAVYNPQLIKLGNHKYCWVEPSAEDFDRAVQCLRANKVRHDGSPDHDSE